MTRNRQENILPLIQYYSAYPVQLIIADGSNSIFSSSQQIDQLLDGSKNASFFLAYTRGPRPDNYIERLSEALSLTDAAYVALAPDDELLVWSGVSHALQTLKDSPDVSSAGGASAICRKFGRNLAFMSYLNYGFPPGDPFHAKEWQQLAIQGASTSDRLREVVTKAMWHRFHTYRVFTKKSLEQVVSLWKATNLDIHSGLGELIFSLGAHVTGKSIFLDYPFWIRSLRSEGGGGVNFGKYADQDLLVIAVKTVEAISVFDASEDKKVMRETELFDLLKKEYGPDSRIRKALDDYVVLNKRRSIRGAVRRLIEIAYPALALRLINRRYATAFEFECDKNSTFGFSSFFNSESHVAEVGRAAHTIKLLI